MKQDEPEVLEFPANGEHLAEVRRTLESLAAHTTLTREQLDDLLTAVDEATANAIRHGSPEGVNSLIRVTCQYYPNGITVEVRDQGNGFSIPELPPMPGPEAMGGRGLPLMCAMSDSVEIASTPGGTSITLKKFTE